MHVLQAQKPANKVAERKNAKHPALFYLRPERRSVKTLHKGHLLQAAGQTPEDLNMVPRILRILLRLSAHLGPRSHELSELPKLDSLSAAVWPKKV